MRHEPSSFPDLGLQTQWFGPESLGKTHGLDLPKPPIQGTHFVPAHGGRTRLVLPQKSAGFRISQLRGRWMRAQDDREQAGAGWGGESVWCSFQFGCAKLCSFEIVFEASLHSARIGD